MSQVESKYLIVLGSNPSFTGGNVVGMADPESRTGNFVRKMLEGLDVQIDYVNVWPEPTPKNRPLSRREMQIGTFKLLSHPRLRSAKWLVLGQTARTAMRWLQEYFGGEHIEKIIDCMFIPHPSGRCRKYNDPEFKEMTIQEVRRYVQS